MPSFKIAIIINILNLFSSPISGDPSIIRGQAWPHPVQREQAHQVASGPVEEISYFIFRSLAFSECLMWASLSRKYSLCGNDPESEKNLLLQSQENRIDHLHSETGPQFSSLFRILLVGTHER